MLVFPDLKLWSVQMRWTVSLPTPKRAAIVRVDQWVEPSTGATWGVVDDGGKRSLGEPRAPTSPFGDLADAVDPLGLDAPQPGSYLGRRHLALTPH